MAVSSVVFADVSSLQVDSTTVEAVTSFQASKPVGQKPIYTWGSPKPRVLLPQKTLGSGSFSYVASDGSGSSAATNWATLIGGTSTVTVTGGLYPSGAGGIVVTCTNCAFAGQSESMSAQNELMVTVNFTFRTSSF